MLLVTRSSKCIYTELNMSIFQVGNKGGLYCKAQEDVPVVFHLTISYHLFVRNLFHIQN